MPAGRPPSAKPGLSEPVPVPGYPAPNEDAGELPGLLGFSKGIFFRIPGRGGVPSIEEDDVDTLLIVPHEVLVPGVNRPASGLDQAG